MKQYRIWSDDAFRVCLLVTEGTKQMHLLHVPSLDHIKVRTDEFARQLRQGVATEVPVTRGLIGRIEARRRDFRSRNAQFSEIFVAEALAAIRKSD